MNYKSTTLIFFLLGTIQLAIASQPRGIRKEVRELTHDEKQAYILGVKKLKEERITGHTYTNMYDLYVEIHRANYQYAHLGPAFLPWHRQFLRRFEKDLRRVLGDDSFMLPYWDWTLDAELQNPINAPIWGDDFMGGNGGPDEKGPFKKWTISGGGQLVRNRGGNKTLTLPTRNDVIYVSNLSIYDVSPWNNGANTDGFRNTLEGWRKVPHSPPNLHNLVHVWVGGSMSEPPTAPNDPVFFLHHCNIDRIWAQWQIRNPGELNPATTTYPQSGPIQGQKLRDALIPWSATTGADEIVTAADMLDFRNLGYGYSSSIELCCTYKDQYNGQLWYITSSDGLSWSTPKTANGVWVDSTPSFARLKNKLYCVHKNQNRNELRCVTLDGERWSDDQIVSGPLLTDSPSLATFKGKLYCAYRGTDNSELYFITTGDGVNWSRYTKVNGPGLSTSPSLATFKGKLYCAYRGTDNNELYFITTGDGVTWSGYRRIDGPLLTNSPSLATFNNKLYCAYRGTDNNELYFITTDDGINWSGYMKINGVSMTHSPSLMAFKDKLCCVFKGLDNKLYYTITSDGENWSSPQWVSNALTKESPSLGIKIEYF